MKCLCLDPHGDAANPWVSGILIGMDRDRCRKAHSPILFDDRREMVASDCGCGAGGLPAPHLLPPYDLPPPGTSRDLSERIQESDEGGLL
jgi:hypothetical protein